MVEKEKEILDANFVDGKSSGCESTKATILRAALEEFALKSVDGARTREIASKANVNHAAINYYFGGKMEMYTEILRASVEHFNEEYAKFLSDSEIFIKSGKSDKKEAISIIKEAFLRSHKNLTSATFFYFMLLVKREETFPTSNFEITFEGSFKLFLTRLVGLIRAIKKELECSHL